MKQIEVRYWNNSTRLVEYTPNNVQWIRNAYSNQAIMSFQIVEVK